MSIVVAVKKGKDIVLASDTQTNFGSHMVPPSNHKAAKIRPVGTAYLAATGWGIYQNILDDFLASRRSISLASERSIFRFFLKFWNALHDRYSLVNDQCDKEETSPFGDLDASFLVVNKKGIFSIASDMSITRFDKFYAIGSGADYAMGALHALDSLDFDAEATARRAVQAAISFNVYCGGETEVRKVKAAR